VAPLPLLANAVMYFPLSVALSSLPATAVIGVLKNTVASPKGKGEAPGMVTCSCAGLSRNSPSPWPLASQVLVKYSWIV